MQAFGPRVDLERYWDDALHREAMCSAFAAEPGRENAAEFAALATDSQASMDAIYARMNDLRSANAIVRRAEALEAVRKLGVKHAYDQLRRDLAAEAAPLVRAFLPVAPSRLGQSSIKRVISMIEPAVANVRGPAFPESVRTEHLPVLEAQLQGLEEADKVEDEAAAQMIALRAAIVLFKADQQRKREIAYGKLIGLVGKTDADTFFLPKRVGRATRIEDDDDEEGGGGGPAAG